MTNGIKAMVKLRAVRRVREPFFMQKICEVQETLRGLAREHVSTEPRTLKTQNVPEVISQTNPIFLYSSGETETKVTAGGT